MRPRLARPALLASALLILTAAFAPAPARADFGFQPGASGFAATATEQGGDAATLAGSHPFALTLAVGFQGSEEPRTLSLELPPGLIENPRAVPQCSQADFQTPRSSPYEASRSGESCPRASQLGTIAVETASTTRHFGLFNLAPPPGYPSRLGAAPFGAPLTFTTTVRQAGGEYGLTLTSANLTQLVRVRALEPRLWGSPWSAAHSPQRGNCLNEADPGAPHASCPVEPSEQPHGARAYLTLPSECSAPLRFAAAADSWQAPGAFATAADQGAALGSCASLGFSFGASALPSSAVGSSPTGLALRLTTSQAGLLGAAQRLASQPRRATVALPDGMTINPSVGAGLGACTPAQYAAESPTSAPGEGCPNPSKIGVLSIETPLVEEPLAGSLFIATPFQNPFGTAYALYLVARSSQRGFIVKVAGRLDADPLSGQLTATFEGLPKLPYSNLKIEFREGQRAPLVTPTACGNYASRIDLVPWADPAASLRQASSFPIARGVGGGPCPSGGALPFAPRAVAGTLNPRAGATTSFYLHLTRTDAEQEITSYSAQLPPGLLGKIAGIPYCSDAAIEAAKGRGGLAEDAAPSCPPASQIGRTFSGYGAGLAPAYSPGRFYLAGPYHGAPLSVVAINPALVGPFDLGTIVIRSAIQVDPRSARVTIDSSASDPIPHIFAGIPLRLRDVRVFIDRPDFMVNPTSCQRTEIASTLTGSDAPFANPRSATATATVPFAAFDCSSLAFAPKLALSVKGPPRRGGYQQLKVTVTPRPGDANISSAAVTLPPSLFLAQNHIRAICTRGQSDRGACPPASIIGQARAETPLLAEPMQGPVYLRSSDNPLPDLVTVLRGAGGVRVVLECRIDSHRRGIRGRCEGLPDASVSRFTMTIFGGRKRGILVSSEELCGSKARGAARFISQNNSVETLSPKLSVKCKKGGGKAKKGKKKATRGKWGSR